VSGAGLSTIVGTVHAGSDRKRATALTAVVGSALLWVGLAASAPGDPKRKLTAEGQALAKRFVLRKADLPLSARWKVEPTDFSQPNPRCLVKHYSYSALTLVGEAGKTFSVAPGIPLVESDANVFVSAAQASRAAVIDQKIGLARCVAASLASEVSKGSPGVSGSVQRVERLSFSGIAGSYGWRIVVGLGSGRGAGTIDATLVGIRRGRELASLSFITTQIPWPRAQVRTFAQKTANRMKTR
jgi:hypothetical protein